MRDLFFVETLSLGTSITPQTIILPFIFLQPFFDFTDNDILTAVKHVLLRLIVIFLFFQTFVHLSTNRGRIQFSASKIERGLLVYVGTAIISVFLAIENFGMGIEKALVSLGTLPLLVSLVYVIPLWFSNKKDTVRMAKWFLASFFVVVIIALMQIPLSLLYPGVFGYNRLSSVFHDPNIFARYLIFGIFYSLALLQADTTLLSGQRLSVSLFWQSFVYCYRFHVAATLRFSWD